MTKTHKYNHAYFEGKTAVITGGAGGIGLALTEELLGSNAAKIVIADINQGRLDECVAELDAKFGEGRVKAINCDVTKEEQIQNLIAQSVEFFDGKFDLLFNNAGATFFDWFVDITDEMWDKAFKLNFHSALWGCKAAIPIMKAQGGGQIVNVISGVAFMPMACWARYSATKAALNAVTMVMRAEHWDDNIKINAVTPGTTATHIFEDAGKATPDAAQTPQQAACRILEGVAKNNRLTLGDDGDVSGAKHGYDPARQGIYDKYLLRVAQERREGKTAI